MKVDVLDIEGKKLREVELPAAIFEAPINVDLMHQAYVRQMANARLGTHDTKVRGEVAGGGAKPYKQKGTGRARQGSRRAAQWVGGGRIHTPHPRSYEQRMPKKMRQAALRSALSAKAAESGVVAASPWSPAGRASAPAGCRRGSGAGSSTATPRRCREARPRLSRRAGA